MTCTHSAPFDSRPPDDPIVDRVVLSLSTGFPTAQIDDAIRPLIEKWKSLIGRSGNGYSRQTYASTTQAVTLTCDLPFHFRGAGDNKVVFIGRLVPFSTSVAAEGTSFIERDGELRNLVFGDQDFALCGPGGIGKSSLLRQMQWTLRRNLDDRYSRLVEVDLLGVCDLKEATRRIAARIQPSRDAQVVSVSSLEPFLRRVRTGDARFHDGPIVLILDEMHSWTQSTRFLKVRFSHGRTTGCSHGREPVVSDDGASEVPKGRQELRRGCLMSSFQD